MSTLRFLRVVTFVLLIVGFLPAGLLKDAMAEDGGEDGAALPLERVTLFTSGVGYFEHRAVLEGNREITLTFDAKDINDLLKSMVVQDLGGGNIAAVTYGSRDPVSKALQSFAVDLTTNLTLSKLFENLRGEKVLVHMSEPVEGAILSVESRTLKEGDTTLTKEYLNLVTVSGIRSIAFDGIRSIKLLNPRLDQEVQQALATLALGRDNQKKSVQLSFLGDGERPVRVSYVQETPVWKTSYRLVFQDEGHAYLQGWAVVENTTNRDWDEVVLTLVSGAPVSFIMNLYEPLYASRPVVQPELRPGVAPQRYERELREELKKVASKSRKAGRPQAQARRRSSRGLASPSSPAEGAEMDDADGWGPGQGVESAAQGAEVGELFQYRIETPVVLGRQRSAMIPIVGENVEAAKVSIFDARVHAKHPLNGIRLKNTTALHLMQGPVTVFDGGTYAGDALLGDLAPGADRLLTYALDLEVELKRERKNRPENLVSVKIVKGVLQTAYTQERTTKYLIRNDDAKARKVILTHPIESGWTLDDAGRKIERTRSDYRPTIDVPGSGDVTVSFVERRNFGQSVLLTNLNDRTIALYLKSPRISDAVKAALSNVARQKAGIQALARKVQKTDREIKAIAKEQDRIRKNMGQIDRDSDLYRRYMQKFGKQEDRIEALRVEQQTLAAQIEEATGRLEAFMMSLVLD